MNYIRLLCYIRLLVIGAVVTVATSACRSEHTPKHLNTEAAIQVGKQIFHDRRLSPGGDVSCASCHDPARHFTDGKAVSVGANGQGGTRNAPSLLDLNDATSFFWDGRETELHRVVLQPFTNAVEMGWSDRKRLVQRIRSLPEYASLMSTAADADADADADGTIIATAITAYLRSLPQGSSRASSYIRLGQLTALNEEESAGLKLFTGKAECSSCHLIQGSNMPLTDNRFHHTGIGFENVAGELATMMVQLETLDRSGHPLGEVILTNRRIAELGRFAASRRSSDLGAFRTPSLRNIAMTAPYMHDGSIPTLQEAVDREIYYRSLARGRPIGLTVDEQRQLLAFLQSLTDQNRESAIASLPN